MRKRRFSKCIAVFTTRSLYILVHTKWTLRYKIGDSFVFLPVEEVQELLTSDTARIDESVLSLEQKLDVIRDEMQELKVKLYARFGRSINLET